jgi:hypothetical protein
MFVLKNAQENLRLKVQITIGRTLHYYGRFARRKK